MRDVDIVDFFSYSEDDKTGDYRQFHIYCPYVENGRGLRFHDTWRVSGTEEALIGEAGLKEKKRRKTAEFKEHLLLEAKRNDKQFELRGKQLWLAASEVND